MYSLWRNLSRQEPKKHTWTSALIATAAEVVGTAILMFLGCMGGATGFKSTPTPSMQGPLVFGLTVTSVIQIFGHVSGAHLNPAVTAAAWVWGLVSLPLALAYIAAQVLGATAGYGLLVAITPDYILDLGRSPNVTGAFCGTVPSPDISTTQAFFAEFVITSLLVFLCCGVWDKRNANNQDSAVTPEYVLDLGRGPNGTEIFCGTSPYYRLTDAEAFFGEFLVTSVLILMCCGCWDERNRSKQDSAGVKFGMLVVAISMAEGPYTGASMNPARTFAPSVVYNYWDRHWIYWVAPLSAGLLITFLYVLIFKERVKPLHDVKSNHEVTQIIIGTDSLSDITRRNSTVNVIK